MVNLSFSFHYKFYTQESNMLSKIQKIGLKCLLYKITGRLFPKDAQILSACDRIGAYRYLEKYKYVLNRLDIKHLPVQAKPNIIWLCWLQGYQNAPLLVQKCRDSIVKHNPDMEIVVVDNTNLEQYVQLPDYIKRKHDAGIIPHAHYADLIRVALLEKYGGTWIDATTYMTDTLPDYINGSELFCFKTFPYGKCYASNWFISAQPNNPIIHQMKSLLFEYWNKESKLVSYSIFHLFWAMTITFNDTNAHLWDKIPYFDDVNCKVLQMELFKPFSQERFDQITAITPIHKLTYKFSSEQYQLENTFYKFLIK